MRLAQAKVPESLSLLAAIALGTTETFAGVLVLIPRYRRWGALLAGALLLVFMAYIGFFYHDLRGPGVQLFPLGEARRGAGLFHRRRGDAAVGRGRRNLGAALRAY